MNRLLSPSALALGLLLVSTPQLFADPVTVNLTADGGSVLLVSTSVGGVQQFAYTSVATSVLDTRTTTFLATYSNVAGVDVLNVTDVCAQVNVLGGTPVPCQALAFSFTDLAHSDVSIVSLLGTAGASVTGNVAAIDFGASLGSGSATLNFTGTPTSATPEPGSLALLATGLCGVAAAARRRLVASAR